MPTIAPYGTWVSPITTDLLVESTVRLSNVLVDGETLYWTEGRPSEEGREVVVRRGPGGAVTDVLPPGYSARTLVHEYGGLCTAVRGGILYFSNFADQRLYAFAPGSDPVALTPEPPLERSWRYAGPSVTPDGAFVICVRERHLGDAATDVVNDLVAVPTDRSAAGDAGAIVVLAEGHDFYGTPAVSPDGSRVAWCCWDHPNMPWDGTELFEAPLELAGAGTGPARPVAGGPGESVVQPGYGPDGSLHFLSDRTGWWNLYRAEAGTPGDGHGAPPVAALAALDAELAGPDWVFGRSSVAFLGDGRVVATWSEAGVPHLGVLEPGADAFADVPTPYTIFESLRPFGAGVAAVGASPTRAPAIVALAVPSGGTTVVRESRGSSVPGGYLSSPRPFEFPTAGGEVAHALVYPPANADFAGPAGERPPLLVAVHGGPTSAASSALNYTVQYWTSRGFVVADLDYRGSSGYGRAYRKRLDGGWGILDVEDAEHLAHALVAAGEVDPARLLIHGGSAGGYTTLCAATFGEVFTAGASYYGVADAGALARETHKFESRYLDGLIGPWPEAEAVYVERSPVFHTEKLRTPLIIFQGLEDKVVPPNQAEMMVDALVRKGVPVAYVAYEGEQHGFRRAESIKRTYEAELYFYGRVLGFEPAGNLAPVEIRNEGAIGR